MDEAGAHRSRPIARVVVAAALPVPAAARAEVVGAVRLARALRKLLVPRFPVLAEPQPPHRLCEKHHPPQSARTGPSKQPHRRSKTLATSRAGKKQSKAAKPPRTPQRNPQLRRSRTRSQARPRAYLPARCRRRRPWPPPRTAPSGRKLPESGDRGRSIEAQASERAPEEPHGSRSQRKGSEKNILFFLRCSCSAARLLAGSFLATPPPPPPYRGSRRGGLLRDGDREWPVVWWRWWGFPFGARGETQLAKRAGAGRVDSPALARQPQPQPQPRPRPRGAVPVAVAARSAAGAEGHRRGGACQWTMGNGKGKGRGSRVSQ